MNASSGDEKKPTKGRDGGVKALKNSASKIKKSKIKSKSNPTSELSKKNKTIKKSSPKKLLPQDQDVSSKKKLSKKHDVTSVNLINIKEGQKTPANTSELAAKPLRRKSKQVSSENTSSTKNQTISSQNSAAEEWMDGVGKNVPEPIKKIYFIDLSPEDLKKFIKDIKSSVSQKMRKLNPSGVDKVLADIFSTFEASQKNKKTTLPLSYSDQDRSFKENSGLREGQSNDKINTISQIITQLVEYQKAYAEVPVGEIIPFHVRELSRTLHKTMIKSLEKTGDISSIITQVYQTPLLTVEQKTLLREEVVKIFSVHTSRILNTKEMLVVEVFGLPAFGDIAEAQKFLSDKNALNKLCKAMISSGCISDQSETVAILNAPLHWSSLSHASVLHSLSSAWGSLVAEQNFIDDVTADEIMRTVMRDLAPHILEGGKTSFVIPGVRVWRGHPQDYVRKTSDFLTQWFKISAEEKAVASSFWGIAAGRLLLESGVEPGSLMIRHPAPPLVVQSQSLAWHVSQQIYERLGMNPFHEINFVSVSESRLVLRAYNHKNTIVAQSDFVSLFDVVSSAEDFSALLKDECSSSGPRTQLQEIQRTLDP